LFYQGTLVFIITD